MSRDASTLFGAGAMQDLALYETTLIAGTIAEHYELGEGGPKASFTSAPVGATAGVPVRLDASGSSSPGGSITDYAWDFDGSKSIRPMAGSSATISHTFSSPGTYTVDLRVKDSLGRPRRRARRSRWPRHWGATSRRSRTPRGMSHFWPMGESSGVARCRCVAGANATLTGGVSLGEPGGLVEEPSHGGGVRRLLGRGAAPKSTCRGPTS